jgi:aminopeptidase N
MNRNLPLTLLLLITPSTTYVCQAQTNPFQPPRATVRYERDRDYDLQHVALRLKIDWAKKGFGGTVTHTLAPLRDGLTQLVFDAGANLNILACSVNGTAAKFTHEGEKLVVSPPGRLPRAKSLQVAIRYASSSAKAGPRSLNGTYGFHWILPEKYVPARKPGFYTQGETEGNHQWVPIYDYPNDKTTSETTVEAPETWTIIGNGKLVSETANKTTHTRTFHWQMTQPHATYLLSLIGGEMDVAHDTWRGVDLWYAVPKGEGKYIPASFGDTKDMLSFFSDRFGVKYAWPKYAQTCVFDFGGGMENVSATTLGEGSLVDARSGIWPMASLNSHELSHQWFGDLITTKDWGHVWLNEGFATFCEQIYLEHSRGKDAYDEEREGALRAYLNESRSYKRPIATNLYPNPDAMFDSHTYPKGGLVLHMLRREMGDEDFFRGLGYYLRKHGYHPVDTDDLIRSLAESSGRTMQGFFDQWVYKPGHPVIDYTWTYDDAAKQVLVTVSQLQDTKDGTPIYNFKCGYALIGGSGGVQNGTLTVDRDKTEIHIPASAKPDAFLLDPAHDILMERKAKQWQPGEALAVVKNPAVSVSWLERRDAALNLLRETPDDATVQAVVETVSGDRAYQGERYARAVVGRLGQLARPALRPLFEAIATSRGAAPGKTVEPELRAAAVTALGSLPNGSPESAPVVRPLVNQKEYFPVVRAAIRALSAEDPAANLPLFRQAATWDTRGDQIRLDALGAIAKAKTDDAANTLVEYTKPAYSRPVRLRALFQLEGEFKKSPRVTSALIPLLKDPDEQVARSAASNLGGREDRSALPALQTAATGSKDESVRKAAKASADKLEGK